MSEADRATLEQGSFELTHPNGFVNQMNAQMEGLMDRLDGDGAIECHGVRFASKHDLINWFKSKNLTIAMFMDVAALMHGIQCPMVSQEMASRSYESQIRTKMTSTLEAIVLTSFATQVPGVLVGNKRNIEGEIYDALLSYLKTHKVWHPKGASKGVQSRVEDGVRILQKRSEHLQACHTTDPEAVTVASGLLANSVHFTVSLTQWVEQAYNEIVADTNFPEGDVWRVILECLEQILAELYQARVVIVRCRPFLDSVVSLGYA